MPLSTRIALTFLASALLALTACAPAGPSRGVKLDPPRSVAAFTFRGPTGAPISTAPGPGQVAVIFFGYTHCPDVCPTTLADWQRTKARLGAKSEKVRFLFVSIDPERDTPAIAARYAARFDPSFIGLSGDAATTSAMLAAFGASAARDAAPTSATASSTAPSATTGYLVSHSAQLFLVNDRGQIIAMYPFGLGWDALAGDLEDLL
ncbi:MAG: SCO family protein [Gemmatimonadaceae bacterium]